MLTTLTHPSRIPQKRPTWNRRFRSYTEKIQTGMLSAICEVLAELYQIRERKGNLSFGERRVYEKAHRILSTEIGLVKDLDAPAAESYVDGLLEKGVQQLSA